MDAERVHSLERLQKCSYRILQRIVKSMELPCNLKKQYLIELIHAKRYLSDTEVQHIITKALEERYHGKNVKGIVHSEINVQGKEITSTNSNNSPPITVTPKRAGLKHGPSSHHPIAKYVPKCANKLIESDRVLRKRTYPRNYKESYGLFDSRLLHKQILPKSPNATVTSDNAVNKVKPIIIKSGQCTNLRSENKVSVPTTKHKFLNDMLSLYSNRYQFSQSIGVRQSDGTVSRINALVPKTENKNVKYKTTTIQNILNTAIGINFLNKDSVKDSRYPNMDSAVDFNTSSMYQHSTSTYGKYVESLCYQNNIQMESVGCQTDMLPEISSVFKCFKQMKNLTLPIYVQTDNNPETVMTAPIMNSVFTAIPEDQDNPHLDSSTDIDLSSLKSANKMNTNTSTLFCSSVCVTSTIQRSAAIHTREPCMVTWMNTFQSSYLDLQNDQSMLKAIDEALDTICQDHEYMQQIEVQCILCHWAGPRNVLESHIREEHNDKIMKKDINEWNVTFSLGNLVHQSLWLSQVIEYCSVLYVLSARYEDPDLFMSSLSTLSSNTSNKQCYVINIYDKVSGVPYTWRSELQQLLCTMPQENDNKNCLTVKLSEMNLTPDIQNMHMSNLKRSSYSHKVIVGKHKLIDTHITLFVEIHDVEVTDRNTID